MTQPRVAVVIVNWNGLADTVACIESLRSSRYPRTDIIVVDNGSTDGSVPQLRATFPNITVLEAGKNLGFTGGNNLGLRQAITSGADYLYWLNNDTVSDAGAIEALVAASEEAPEYGILTPVIHYFDEPGDAWFAGSSIDLGRGIAAHDNVRTPGRAEPVREIPWASGCAMFGRCNLLASLGGFDDRYFLNWEDVDLSIRLGAAGYKIGLVPAARIYHKVGRSFAAATGGTGKYYYVRNHLLLLRLHLAGARSAQCWVALQHLQDSVRAMRRREPRGLEDLVATARGVFHHLVGRYGGLRAANG